MKWLLLAVIAIFGCAGDDFGATTTAQGCAINTDCVSPLVCAFKRCHTACTNARDCQIGQECVGAGEFSVCALPDDPSDAGASPDAPKDVHVESAPAEASVDAQSEAPATSCQVAPDGGCITATCASLGKSCGPVADCCGGTLNCGSCPIGEKCGGGGTPNVCGGCVPDTCALHGYDCGSIEDGCGNTVACGNPWTRLPAADFPAAGTACKADHPYYWSCPFVAAPQVGFDCVYGGKYVHCCTKG